MVCVVSRAEATRSPMFETQPRPEDAGRVFYDGRKAWTGTIEAGTPVWKRVPEKDTKHLKDLEKPPRENPTRPPNETNTEATKTLTRSEP